MTYSHGSHHPAAVLTEERVRLLREDYDKGATYRELAKKYKVSRQCAWLAVNRVTWRHVT